VLGVARHGGQPSHHRDAPGSSSTTAGRRPFPTENTT
jgi:hypothetical protein